MSTDVNHSEYKRENTLTFVSWIICSECVLITYCKWIYGLTCVVLYLFFHFVFLGSGGGGRGLVEGGDRGGRRSFETMACNFVACWRPRGKSVNSRVLSAQLQ